MVRFTKLLLYRTPRRPVNLQVTRDRPVAQGAEVLFDGDHTVNLMRSLDGVTTLHSKLALRLAKDGCANRPFYRIVVAGIFDPLDYEVSMHPLA